MDAPSQTYTLDSLANVLNVPAERLKSWVRAGLVRPVRVEPGVFHFDFQQVSAAKSLCDLLGAGVTLGRIRKSLDQLRRWKTDADASLEQLAILERTGVLLVRLDQDSLAETDGQYHFDFDPPPTDTTPMRIVPGPRTPDDWFQLGLQQEEEGQLPEAAGSYRQALLAGGPTPDACFALANVLRAMGERQQAVERYLQVVEMDVSHSDAWNNLGLCLEELGSVQEAAGAFRRALDAAPDNWRAQYNLADALDELGQIHEAKSYWREYLRHDRDSEHASHARKRLAEGGRG